PPFSARVGWALLCSAGHLPDPLGLHRPKLPTLSPLQDKRHSCHTFPPDLFGGHKVRRLWHDFHLPFPQNHLLPAQNLRKSFLDGGILASTFHFGPLEGCFVYSNNKKLSSDEQIDHLASVEAGLPRRFCGRGAAHR